MLLECQPNQTRIVDFWLIVNFWASAIFYYSVSSLVWFYLLIAVNFKKLKGNCNKTGKYAKGVHSFLHTLYRRPKVFSRSRSFLTFSFAFGCRRSMQPKAEGLAEGWNIWNSVNLSANFVTKILEWSKCMFVQCSKRFEILYYIISIRAFQSLCLNMPTEYLNTKYQTFGFTFGFDFEGRSFSTFAFGFGYGQKNHLR